MRRINIAFVATILLCACVAFAQQSNNSSPTARTMPPPPGTLTGSGAAHFIPVWTNSTNLADSQIYQNSAGLVGINTTAPTATLDVNGWMNTASGYYMSGNKILSVGSLADNNLFVGSYAGFTYTPGNGAGNAFTGYAAGYSNSTGNGNSFYGELAGALNESGSYNSFVGGFTGYFNTTGWGNTFLGYAAGYNNSSATWNTFSGYLAGYYNTTGSQNTFSGSGAGQENTTGSQDTYIGYAAGELTTSGSSNTTLGSQAGEGITYGSYNTYIGAGTGQSDANGNSNIHLGFLAGQNNTTGSNNIYIGDIGCAYPCAESNTIRIGGFTQATTTYIAGIYGASSSGGIPVYVNSNGQLGTSSSSLRFKEQVRDMGDSTDALMKLRPVTFVYKAEYANGERTLQYGLIAEEVAKVYPELVAYGNDRQPYSVRYQYLSSMLLNEVQKQYRRAEAEAEQIKAQQQEIESLRQQQQLQNATLQERLSRLEKQVRVNTAEVAPAGTTSAQ